MSSDCKYIVNFMLDNEFTEDDLQIMAKWSTGPLEEELTKAIYKMQEEAMERERENQMYAADAAYEDAMEAKGERQREERQGL